MIANNDIGKKAAGEAAAELVQAGMCIGLGTGSTTNYFIKRLAERCASGLEITAVASSNQSTELAYELGIPLVDIDPLIELDLTVDGADEIDPQKRMIKGGGGALLREKIVATMSKEMIVIVDSKKCVAQLGSFPLPVEIAPFAWKATLHHLASKKIHGNLRLCAGKLPYVTDNGNYIYDIAKEVIVGDLEALNQVIVSIPGVLETGFFFNQAGRVIIGYDDGHVEILGG
jgi:ribose 5-phosphate isomerase A